MKTKQFISLIIILLLGSCKCQDTLYKLSSDQKPVYEVGDTLIYKSNLNNYDTFIVKYNVMHKECEDDENYCNTETCEEYCHVVYCRTSSYKIDTNWISAFNRGAKYKWQGSIQFNGFCINFRNKPDDFYSYFDTTINGVNISHAVAMVSNEWLDTDIYKLIYSHKYGVLYYEKKNGEKWNLQFNY